MDKKYHVNACAEFKKEGSCYIHTEMRNGKAPETVICGDFIAMLWGIRAELSRIAELTGTTIEDATFVMLGMEQHGGYNNLAKKLKDKGDEYREIKGSEWADEEIAKAKTEANRENMKLLIKNEHLEAENIKLNNLMVGIRKEKDKIIKAKDKQILELSKDINRLEHECDEYVKKIESMSMGER